jgi:hypothetical protein
MTYAAWLADVLRAADVAVVEHRGWRTRGHGGFTKLTHVVWHHDASPKGDSPGVCQYMLDNWNTHGAQLWVSRQGEWHILAAGVAYHAGKTRSGKPGNRQSLGVETDHTTGEAWPAKQLASLRRGTAAILRHLGRTADSGLEFHKTICEPVGRKTDPDGLSLANEQRAVHALMAAPTRPPASAMPAPATPTRPAPPAPAPLPVQEDDDMAKLVTADGVAVYLVTATRVRKVADQTELTAWRAAGIVGKDEHPVTVSLAQLDALERATA